MPALTANGRCQVCGAAVHLTSIVGDHRRIRLNLRATRRGAIALDAVGVARWVGPIEGQQNITYEPHGPTCRGRDRRRGDAVPLVLSPDVEADEAWREVALSVVERVAGSLPDLTSDDVWAAGVPKPREPRALGGVMEEAARRGWIAKTDRVRPSLQQSRHSAPVAVWVSLRFT